MKIKINHMQEQINQLLQQSQYQSERLKIVEGNINKILVDSLFPDWISRKSIMEFLDYGDTQMAALLKEPALVVCEIGARKFIERKSFLKFLERNIRKVNHSSQDKLHSNEED